MVGNQQPKTADIASFGACPVSLRERGYRADARLLKHHGGNPAFEIASLEQTAEAACRVILAGAATTGAGRGHPSFDPIQAGQRPGCWATWTREAW